MTDTNRTRALTLKIDCDGIAHIGASRYGTYVHPEVEADILTLQQLVREMAGLLRLVESEYTPGVPYTHGELAIFDKTRAFLASLPEGYGDELAGADSYRHGGNEITDCDVKSKGDVDE